MGKPMSTVYVPDEYGRLVPTQVPTWVGFVGWYAGPEPPEGYLYCDGSAIGRETYSELYEAIGTLYGAGDGMSTFELPDARGIFFRGDGGENNAAMGVRQGDAIRNAVSTIIHIRSITTKQDTPIKSGALSWNTKDGVGQVGQYPAAVNTSPGDDAIWFRDLVLDLSRAVPTASENRPINMALKPCIRYV